MTDFKPIGQIPNEFDRASTENVLSSVENAQYNTQPFMGMSQTGEPVVVGDVNNIDSDNEYLVEFLYPKGYTVQGEYEETEDGLLVTRRLSGVTVTPRKARRMRHAVSTLLLYFSKVSPSTGEQELMTIGDVASIYGYLSDEVVGAMETVIMTTLGISEFDMEYLTDRSLVQNVGDIVRNNSGFFQ